LLIAMRHSAYSQQFQAARNVPLAKVKAQKYSETCKFYHPFDPTRSDPMVCAGSFQKRRRLLFIRTASIGTHETSTHLTRFFPNGGLVLVRQLESTTRLRSSRSRTDQQTARGRTWLYWRCVYFSAGSFGDSGSLR
jgi:hypothetical protein